MSFLLFNCQSNMSKYGALRMNKVSGLPCNNNCTSRFRLFFFRLEETWITLSSQTCSYIVGGNTKVVNLASSLFNGILNNPQHVNWTFFLKIFTRQIAWTHRIWLYWNPFSFYGQFAHLTCMLLSDIDTRSDCFMLELLLWLFFFCFQKARR